MDENNLPTQITEDELEEEAVKQETSAEKTNANGASCSNNCPLLFAAGLLLIIAGLSYLFYQIYMNKSTSYDPTPIPMEKQMPQEESEDEGYYVPEIGKDNEMTEDELLDNLTDEIDKDMEKIESELDAIDAEMEALENAEL